MITLRRGLLLFDARGGVDASHVRHHQSPQNTVGLQLGGASGRFQASLASGRPPDSGLDSRWRAGRRGRRRGHDDNEPELVLASALYCMVIGSLVGGYAACIWRALTTRRAPTFRRARACSTCRASCHPRGAEGSKPLLRRLCDARGLLWPKVQKPGVHVALACVDTLSTFLHDAERRVFIGAERRRAVSRHLKGRRPGLGDCAGALSCVLRRRMSPLLTRHRADWKISARISGPSAARRARLPARPFRALWPDRRSAASAPLSESSVRLIKLW